MPREPSRERIRLIVRPGKVDEETFELGPGAYTIGRTQQNDVFVLHESLSRQHARLVIDERGAVLEDLASKNGTFVDGVRIARRRLGAAHYLKLGDVVFSYVGPRRRDAPTLTMAPEARLDDLEAAARAARSVSGAERDRDKLRILLAVSELLSSPGKVDALLDRIVALAFQILAIDRATMLLAEEDGLKARIGRTRDGPTPPDETQYSSRIVAHAVEGRAAVLFDDVRDDPRLAPGGSIAHQSICASMCAPLVTRDGRLVGALYVDNLSEARPFDAGDLGLLSAFASQAAIAIDHARLAERLREEAAYKAHLLRFFPPTAIDAILRQGVDLVETEAAILFCDISGYTAFSSERPPREVIAMLNTYFPVMAEIVFRHDGTLEKYVGDAILAAWGVPLRRSDDAERAVAAAVAMQRAMDTLRARWPLDVHIGIASGPVAAGNVGTKSYLQYATVGDVTNRAARICAVAGAGQIVIDEATRRRLPQGFALEALPPTLVKGKAEPLVLHRLAWRGA